MKILSIKWITAGLAAVFMTLASLVLYVTIGLLIFVAFCHIEGYIACPIVFSLSGFLAVWTGICSFRATLRHYDRKIEDMGKSRHTWISNRLIPSDRFEIETSLPIEAIVDILKTNIQPKKMFHTSSDHALFQGDISQVGFKITRIINYRNSFLPIVTGQLVPTMKGTKIEIRMDLHPFIIAFMCIWFGFVGLGCIGFLLVLLSGKMILHPASFIPLGILIFGWVLTSKCFWFEARKQKPLLIEMFK